MSQPLQQNTTDADNNVDFDNGFVLPSDLEPFESDVPAALMDTSAQTTFNVDQDWTSLLESFRTTEEPNDLFAPVSANMDMSTCTTPALYGTSTEYSGSGTFDQEGTTGIVGAGQERDMDPTTTPSSGEPRAPGAVKLGGRFARQSIRLLNDWLSEHRESPYPTEDQRQELQDRTGLSRAQIANWFANARRRGKVPSRQSSGPKTKAIDMPARSATPAIPDPTAYKSPMQRWVDSPPEHEPASVAAISQAVTVSGLRLDSGTTPSRSRRGDSTPSARSVNTSFSSGDSLASAHSFGSFSSFESLRLHSQSRRKKRQRARVVVQNTTAGPSRKRYECTFCTESFKTKFDWQRHENALHLPLERWVCIPRGPVYQSEHVHVDLCVFCGETSPDAAHLQTHNSMECEGRTESERIFNRKDHLRQHLRLVHDAKFSEESMRGWQIPMPKIRSRCGFCSLVMETWEERIHHLGDHFRVGKTMADWTGDRGFEPAVDELVERAMPPYMIDTERRTPLPFEASKELAGTPPSAYELLKLEIAYFMQNHFHRANRLPTSDEIQLEACRIILASEVTSSQDARPLTWLRDVIMSRGDLVQMARFGPIRSPAEGRLHVLKVNGRDHLFDDCMFEQKLRGYTELQSLMGHVVSHSELHQEACRIVGSVEDASATPSDFIASWLVKLMNSSGLWLAGFQSRSGCSPLSPDQELILRPDATIHDFSRLEQGLGGYFDSECNRGHMPTDAELRRQARIIVHLSDESWGQTAADDDYWISGFRQRRQLKSLGTSASTPAQLPTSSMATPQLLMTDMQVNTNAVSPMTPAQSDQYQVAAARSLVRKPGKMLLNDANYFNWVKEELTRWVAATMSPHNPTCHVPSDKEIQHYARWLSYNDDDPFNDTAADDGAWLMAFKREVGILT